MSMGRNVSWAATLGLALAVSLPAAGQTTADFYKGRDVMLLVGSGAGGAYDVYSRALARHWGRHIPGNPNIVVSNMPGAGGLTMLNHLANVAKTDGSVIGSAFANTVIQPVFDKGKVTKYDSRRLNWLGSVSPQSLACFTRKGSTVSSIEDARRTPAIMAATGGSISAMSAHVVNAMLGTKFKIVMGYTTAETALAIERGEADGTCLSSATLIARNPDWIEKKLVNWLLVLSNKPDPALPGVPVAVDLVKTEEERQVLDLITSQVAMGRPYVVPAAVPADRVQILRTSFMETLRDPAFVAESARLEMIIDPSDHREMEEMINHTYSLPERIVERARQLIEGTPQ
jgi:tripartite-type tricarboxylate transporter receptor subunit TctC